MMNGVEKLHFCLKFTCRLYVTVAEVEDAEESGDTAYAVTHGESPCRLIVDSRHTPDQNYREWGSATPVT